MRRHLNFGYFGPRALLVGIAAIGLLSIACNGDDGSDEPAEETAATATTSTQPAATSTTSTQPVATATTRAPEATVAPTATATADVSVSVETPGPSSGPSGALTIPIFNLFDIHAIHYLTGFRPSGAQQVGAVKEALFRFEDGNPMTPNLLESWEIDPAGTKVSMTLKPGIPWNGPRSVARDFGDLTSGDVVEFLNRTNNQLNPECVGGNCGDLGAIFGEAFVVDDLSFEVPLRLPVFFCLPLSDFGCLGAGGHLDRVLTVDEEGEEWATQNQVTNGPWIQGDCKGQDRCTIHAVETHFRKVPEVAEITGIHTPETATQIAGILNGTFDFIDIPFELVPGLIERNPDSIHWVDVGQFIGQSLLFSGNLWEETHAVTGEPLNPWDAPSYDEDLAWIGDPWQETHPDRVRYTDTDNPPGMTDMEQARLVRLALSYGIDRDSINDNVMQGLGELLFSEYMGPQYQGWDPGRSTGAWDVAGNRIDSSGTMQSVPWAIPFDPAEANRLLDLAGYPRDGSGKRSGFGKLTFDGGSIGELGSNNVPISAAIASNWADLGLDVEFLDRNYPRDVSPVMRQREQFFPVFKNGDIHSNIWPTDFPLPPTDSSITRPGWGVGFESVPAATWFFEISSEPDRAVREHKQLEWIDYSMYWVQYIGVYQGPVGILAGNRIKDWPQPMRQFFAFQPGHAEYIRLN